MYENHHKTDAIFLALAMVGFEIMDEQAMRANGIARALGDRDSAVRLMDRADEAVQARHALRSRTDRWEEWDKAQGLSNLGLALAMVGYLRASDRFWTVGLSADADPTLLAQGDLCDDAAYELWERVS